MADFLCNIQMMHTKMLTSTAQDFTFPRGRNPSTIPLRVSAEGLRARLESSTTALKAQGGDGPTP
jgi:hypothetical protein